MWGAYGSGLAVIDISDPTNPGPPIYEYTSGGAYNVYVSGAYAYVTDYNEGLAVVAISEPIYEGTPVYKDTTGWALGVHVSGNYAYVADFEGLAVIDISDPTNPGTPVYENTTGSALDVYVSGDYAYVADFNEGLAVINISDPTNPGTPVYENTTGKARGVYVSGNYAYVADDISGLAIIDISDPTNPGTPVYENTNGFAFDVYVSGNYAYVANGNEGLVVINISDPTSPGTPVYENTTGSAYDVYVSGDYAYVADFNKGLAVINISNPTNPGTPVYENTTGQASGVYVSGDYAYIADGDGLEVINISDPTDPETLFYRDMVNNLGYVYVNGDYAYMSCGGTGLGIIQVRMRMEAPIILNTPNDLALGFGYTGQSLSWIATDPNPSNYTIELQGLGIVAGSTNWTSGVAITYNIPDGFSVGSYTYIVNFTDDYGNSITDSVTFTVFEVINPTITSAPSDLTVVHGYTGKVFSWTATDANPSNYTIELQGLGIVAGSTNWTSGVAITYNIPNGFSLGSYTYTVNFTDDYGNSITDNVTFTVAENDPPNVINSPYSLTTALGYTGQSLSWIATDANPSNYTIELQGLGIVAGSTNWTSGVAITYNIPDGFSVGSYTYIVNFTDDYGNSITDSVTFTVFEEMTRPVITSVPIDLTLEFGYTGQSLSWTATDANPDTYTIELLGSSIVVGPTSWTSGTAITYNIPNGFIVGDYEYKITFIDESGNSISDRVRVRVDPVSDDGGDNGDAPPEGTVPLGNYFLIFIVLSVIYLIFTKKRQTNRESR